jgi:anti-anti-sigma factor
MASIESATIESVTIESSAIAGSPRGRAPTPGDPYRTVVWLRGEHDLVTKVALGDTLAQAVALDEADLVIDLSQVQFMDAATISVILRTRNALHPRSRSLTLRSPWGLTRRVLDLCGLTDLIDADPADARPAPVTTGRGGP